MNSTTSTHSGSNLCKLPSVPTYVFDLSVCLYVCLSAYSSVRQCVYCKPVCFLINNIGLVVRLPSGLSICLPLRVPLYCQSLYVCLLAGCLSNILCLSACLISVSLPVWLSTLCLSVCLLV